MMQLYYYFDRWVENHHLANVQMRTLKVQKNPAASRSLVINAGVKWRNLLTWPKLNGFHGVSFTPKYLNGVMGPYLQVVGTHFVCKGESIIPELGFVLFFFKVERWEWCVSFDEMFGLLGSFSIKNRLHYITSRDSCWKVLGSRYALYAGAVIIPAIMARLLYRPGTWSSHPFKQMVVFELDDSIPNLCF